MGDISSTGASKTQPSGMKTVALVIGAALIAGVLGFLLCQKGPALLPGDEPPIRVRGGSIDFELLSTGAMFEPQSQGNRKKWIVTGGNRRTDDLLVYVAPDSFVRCGGVSFKKKVKKVQFWYSNDGYIEVHASQNKTRIEAAHVDLNANGDYTKLSYGGTNVFVQRITYGNRQDWCNFTSKAELDGAIIAEEP